MSFFLANPTSNPGSCAWQVSTVPLSYISSLESPVLPKLSDVMQGTERWVKVPAAKPELNSRTHTERQL